MIFGRAVLYSIIMKVVYGENIDLLIGQYLLADEDKMIFHDEYVSRVGQYWRRLENVKYRVFDAEKLERLTTLYLREYESAKFWATYPKDISKLTRREKQHIFAKSFPQMP